MMGGVPIVYVIVIKVNDKDWYLHDLQKYTKGLVSRQWTRNLKTAWHFKSNSDAVEACDLAFKNITAKYEIKPFTVWSIEHP